EVEAPACCARAGVTPVSRSTVDKNAHAKMAYDRSFANRSTVTSHRTLKDALLFPRLFEFLAAQIHRLEATHIADVVERILRQHQEIGRLALGERAEILVDAEHLGIVPGEGLNDLHRRQAGLDQKLHLAMLEEALDEVTLGGAAGIGAETEANVGVPQPLDVDLVLLERTHRGR